MEALTAPIELMRIAQDIEARLESRGTEMELASLRLEDVGTRLVAELRKELRAKASKGWMAPQWSSLFQCASTKPRDGDYGVFDLVTIVFKGWGAVSASCR